MTRFLLHLLLAGTAHTAEPAFFLEMPWRYLLGAQQDGTWFTSEQTGKNFNRARNYQLYTLEGKTGVAKAGKAEADVDVCPDVWLVPISPEPDPDARSIGVNAPWDPQPRIARKGALTVEAYLKSTSELLAANGLGKSRPKLTQHLRIDLDHDGEDEVLIAAELYQLREEGGFVPVRTKAGDYSAVYLRRLVEGKVRTQLLVGDFYPKPEEFNLAWSHQVTGLLDLDGDGTLEIIIQSAYYEGATTTVWKLGKQGDCVKVLELACGV